jgi:hypothetical protein
LKDVPIEDDEQLLGFLADIVVNPEQPGLPDLPNVQWRLELIQHFND